MPRGPSTTRGQRLSRLAVSTPSRTSARSGVIKQRRPQKPNRSPKRKAKAKAKKAACDPKSGGASQSHEEKSEGSHDDLNEDVASDAD